MTPADQPEPLILTALLDPASQARFDRERQRHFPAKINHIAAHVTLFHHLPGGEQATIDADLTEASRGAAAAPFSIAGLRSLGRGTAYELLMPQVVALRSALARRWQSWLTAQDRQGWRPHVTVQNKVTPTEARQLHAMLEAGFVPCEGMVQGLALWRYLGGPWELLARYPFIDAIA